MSSLLSSNRWNNKEIEEKAAAIAKTKAAKTERAPVETIISFGKSERVPKTKHWGLGNLLSQGTQNASNRNQTFNIPSALSSEKNMMLQQPMLQRRVKMIACSQKSTVALLVGGEMYTWGENDNSIGGDTVEISIDDAANAYDKVMWPRKIEFDKEVMFVAAGHDHFAALTVETKYNLYTWGQNSAGQLGHGDTQNKKKPRKIITWKKRRTGKTDFGNTLAQYVKDDLSDIRLVHVACSYKFTIAVADNNRMFGWGKNNRGQLGLSRAVVQDNQTRGMESRKRVKAFSELFVVWPVELAEMKELGYNQNTVVREDTQVQVAQLMISVGTNHSSSWIHLENLNQFSKSYQVEHERLQKRVQQLEMEAIKLRKNAALGAGASEKGRGKTLSNVTADTVVHAPRRVTDDPTLNATGQLVSELHAKLLIKQVKEERKCCRLL